MSYTTAELLGRVERRRRFSVEQKLAVLAEAMAPGANISAVARRHGLLPAQVYKWRRLAELGVIGVPMPRSCRRSWRSKSPGMFGHCQRRFWETSRPQPMTRGVAGSARKWG